MKGDNIVLNVKRALEVKSEGLRVYTSCGICKRILINEILEMIEENKKQK